MCSSTIYPRERELSHSELFDGRHHGIQSCTLGHALVKKGEKGSHFNVSYLQRKSQSRAVKMQHWVPIRAEKIKTWIIAAHRSTSGNPSTTLEVKSYYPHFTEEKTETQVQWPALGQHAGVSSRHRACTQACLIPNPVLSTLPCCALQAPGHRVMMSAEKKGLSNPPRGAENRPWDGSSGNRIPCNVWKQNDASRNSVWPWRGGALMHNSFLCY